MFNFGRKVTTTPVEGDHNNNNSGKARIRQLVHARVITRKENHIRLSRELEIPLEALRQFAEGADNLSDEALSVVCGYFLDNVAYDGDRDLLTPKNRTPARSVGVTGPSGVLNLAPGLEPRVPGKFLYLPPLYPAKPGEAKPAVLRRPGWAE